MSMDLGEESSRFLSLPATTSRNLSSSSSTFFSANQSPFFSPRSPTCQLSESTLSDIPCDNIQLSADPLSTVLSADPLSSSSGNPDPQSLKNVRFTLSNMSIIPGSHVSSDFQKFNRVSPSTGISNSTTMSNHSHGHGNGYSQHTEKQKKLGRSHGISFAPTSASFSSNRLRSCDVFIGLHGRKPPLLRFANWLRAELEVQGMSCFVSDRARCRNSRKHGIVERAMDVSTFGVVIYNEDHLKLTPDDAQLQCVSPTSTALY